MLATAAIVAFTSCAEKEEQLPIEPEGPAVDNIELTKEKIEFGKDGGKNTILVTSSGDWTLTSMEEYSWVTPSIKSGSDGDQVDFTALPNVKEDLTAEFTFTCGEAEAKLQVISHAGPAPKDPFLTLTSPDKADFNFEGGSLSIKISSTANYKDLICSVTEGTESWCVWKSTLEGIEEGDATITYEIAKLEDLENRNSEITISAAGLQPVKVAVSQLAQLVLESSALVHSVPKTGASITIPVRTNVAYKYEISEDAKSWITYNKKEGTNEIFTVAALEKGQRSGSIVFTQTDAAVGSEALTFTVTVSQQSTLVYNGVKLDGTSSLYLDWTEDSKTYDQFAIELLVKADELVQGSTLLGVDSKYALTFGDADRDAGLLVFTVGSFDPLYQSKMNFNLRPATTDTWYHIVLSMNHGQIHAYRDGVNSLNASAINGVTTLSIFEKGSKFEFGKGFKGTITECRIWNKNLVENDIKVENHFYNVDPKSDNLVAYWKFNQSSGNVIPSIATGKDAINGLTLKSDKDINWVPLAMPSVE